MAYSTLVFIISWSSILFAYGPGVFLGTREVSFMGAGPFAYLGFLAGPSVAGILLTGLVQGMESLCDIRSHLFNWHVSARWYAVALLTAPLLMTATLAALSLTSPVFLLAIIIVDNKVGLLVPAIIIGLVVPFFEELGWTGFAIPKLSQRYGILATGLIVGLLWGALHFPLFSASVHSSGVIPPALYEAILLFSWLLPYRVLMVWVYNHTKSLLVAHAYRCQPVCPQARGNIRGGLVHPAHLIWRHIVGCCCRSVENTNSTTTSGRKFTC